MKKTYSRPTIEFVNFTLASSIAATCKWQANFVETDCSPVVESNGYTIYNQAYDCDVPVDGNDDGSSVCYHVPTADSSLFSS